MTNAKHFSLQPQDNDKSNVLRNMSEDMKRAIGALQVSREHGYHGALSHGCMNEEG